MRNTKTFDQFVNEAKGDKKMTQEEFNTLHDKFYEEGYAISKKKPKDEEYKERKKVEGDVYHNDAVTYLSVKLGNLLNIPRAEGDETDQDYSYTVEDDPEFIKYSDAYMEWLRSKKK